MTDEVLTLQEVADFLKVSPMTVYRRIDDGQLKAFKLGKAWRIRREDLDAFIDQLESDSKHNPDSR